MTTGLPRPLAGVRVLEFAGWNGVLAGRLLADDGADVVRVVPPGGDFLASDVGYEDIIAAITGATEHARPRPEPVYPVPRRIGPVR